MRLDGRRRLSWPLLRARRHDIATAPAGVNRDIRRTFRVVFEEHQPDSTTRRGTITVSNLGRAREEARFLARDGNRAEVHYGADSGERERLEENLPKPWGSWWRRGANLQCHS
jgi:hypothetical protein